MFKDFFQGLTAELVEAAKSVTNSLKSDGYLKRIKPLMSRADAHYESWVDDMERYFLISKAREEEKSQATLLTTGGEVGRYIQGVIWENQNVSWEDLKYLLGEYYGINSNPHEFFLQLVGAQQGRHEGLQNYMQRIFHLADKAYKGTNKSDPIVREQVKRFFIEGLRDPGVKLAVLRNEPPTVEAAYQKAITEDRWRSRITAPSQMEPEPMEVCHARRRRTHIDTPVTENRGPNRYWDRGNPITEQRFAQPVGRNRDRIIECWRCRKKGHTWRQCWWQPSNQGNGITPSAATRAGGNAHYRRM